MQFINTDELTEHQTDIDNLAFPSSTNSFVLPEFPKFN